MEAGWYSHPDMPGTQRYWDGGAWSDHVAPLPQQAGFSTWKGIRIVAVGILVALATVWVVWRMVTPSEVDCSLQEADVLLGERAPADVDPACR